MGLSDHTILINIIIGLSYNNIPNWNNVLWKLGYEISAIEPKIPLSAEKNSNPDVILYSKKHNHIIIVDCKSKTLKEEQTEKYVKLKENPSILITYGYAPTPPNDDDINGDVTFVSFHNLQNIKLITSNNIPTMFVIKEENIIKKIERTGCFTIEDLNNIFPISINSKPPYYLYPFDLEDYDLFKQHILHKLIKYALETKEFTLDELLRDIHPMWDYIHTEKRKAFRNKARDILKDLTKSKELKDYLKTKRISRSVSKWYINTKDKHKSLQTFISRCKKLATSESTNLDQFMP